ncbi:hypothetical protein I4U23_023168 [Adineta vaga]|nr:hypothetical protein I4U23_023168 [Adineta vaga]
MNDKEPLLTTTSDRFYNNDIDEDNKNKQRLLTNSFSDWRQWFDRRAGNKQDGNIDNNTNFKDKMDMVSVIDLFRFADRIDFILMSIGIFFLLLMAAGLTITQVTFGQLIGLFAEVTFAKKCHHQQQNLIISNLSNYVCPPGININSENYMKLYTFCHYNNVTVTSPSNLFLSSFRGKVMGPIYRLIIVGIVEFVCVIILFICWSISLKRQTYRMSTRLFQSLLQRNISYLDRVSLGHINSKLFDNIRKIDSGVGYEFLLVTGVIFCIILDIVASFIINWKLTLVLVCILPLIIITSIVFSKIIANEELNVLNSYSKAGQIAEEVFSSLRTVLSLNGSKFEQNRYENELYSTTQSSIRQGAVFGLFAGWLSFSTYLIYSIGFSFGSVFMFYYHREEIDLIEITIVVSVFAQSMNLFSLIGPFLQTVAEARGAAVQIYELIDAENDASINEIEIWNETRSSKKLINTNLDITFDNVNFTYSSRKDMSVLKNLSFIARAGKTTAIVGPSGCGKSTCLSLLLRYYEPSSGHILINGQSIKEYNLKQLRQTIGVVNQEPMLFATSIAENIRFGKENATMAEIEEAARQANAHTFIMQLPNKYETLVGERGVQLSGGEKQRIALARALVKQSTILLLDEATSALDNVNEKIVQEALDRAYQGRTTIVIAHRLSTIQNADHIYVLDNGSVIEEGTHEILMAKEGSKYQEMIKNQQVEKFNDDEDDLYTKVKVDEDADHKSVLERSRLPSYKQAIDTDTEDSSLTDEQFIFIRLLSMNRPEWFYLVIGSLASILNGIGVLFFAFLVARTIYQFTICEYFERRHRVLTSSLLLASMGLLIWIIRFLQYMAFAISGSKLTRRVRSTAFQCFLRQEVAYFDRPENSTGAICGRLFADASAVQQMSGTRLGLIFETVAMIFFGLLSGILLSWQLTMIALSPLLLLIPAMYASVRVEMWLNGLCDLIHGQANMIAVEAIHNMRTVKHLSAEKIILNKYSKLMYQIVILYRKYSILFTMSYGFLWIIDSFTTAFLYWYALILFERNQFSFDDIIVIIAFVIFVMQAVRSVEAMSKQIGVKLVNFRGEIEFNQVKFSYPTRPTITVLNKFQLKINPGQRVAIVGASGSGKSTLIHLLERLYDVKSGQLLIDGVDIRQLNIQWIRSQLGLVGQEPILFNLTIAENIAYGLENVPEEDIINAAINANIHDFIQQLPQRYETKVGSKGSFLSGGEKQRIAIARILLRKPKILLLDEATSALDSYNEQIVQQTLEQAQKEDPNRTSLIIAHRLSTIRSCDLIFVVDKGYIIESGTDAELIQQHGAYYTMLTRNNA